jgi:hypothetical protein
MPANLPPYTAPSQVADVPYIVREDDGTGGVTWRLPRGKGVFLLVFGTLWCVITAFVSTSFAVAFFRGNQPKGDLPEWVMIPFFGAFWAIGIGVLYAGIRMKFSRHHLVIANGQIVLRREIFGRVTEKSLDAGAVLSVSEKMFYEQNHQPVTGIELRSERGRLRFGSGLEQMEKERLIGEIKMVLYGNKVTTPQAPETDFSIPIPRSRSSLWTVAVIFLVMGVTILLLGTYKLPHVKGISHLGVLMNLGIVFACLGGTGTAWLLMTGGRETVLEGDRTQVAVRLKRHGSILMERVHQRSDVSAVRLAATGVQMNGQDMKRVELVAGGNTDVLVRWMEASQAEDLAHRIRTALGLWDRE